MIENNPSNVSSAFEMLLEEVEAESDFVNNVGSKGFEARDYDKAREALERAGTLTGRLKGPGMRWDKDNAESVMALASIYHSGLWRTYWKKERAAA